jgi:MEKHLA domain
MIDFDSPFLFEHAALLRNSYRHWTGNTLLASEVSPADAVRALYEAPFALVSHDAQPDPVFTYGNRLALQLFEMTWDEFTALTSRLSAEPANQKERYRLLAQVSTQGYSDHYSGVRISKTGRRFMIRAATVWNLIDGEGYYRGQAAVIREWRALA